MTWKTGCKVLSLVALGVATTFATSSLLAQVRPKSRKKPTATATLQVKIADAPNDQFSRVAALTHGTVSVDLLNVTPGPNGLVVTGQASVRELRPNVAYVWALRVRDAAAKTVLAESRYDTQVFQVPRDTQTLLPTFDDTLRLPLPAGKYKVELALYEVPPGGIELLDNPNVKTHQLMAKKTAAVTISQ